ncbi:MAG: 1-phosphofructokinase family hexose kinase [Acidobacteria bacterium]|nr:1-phosphofructokinase family hexose kinase [Acidobacteriota bacterium]
MSQQIIATLTLNPAFDKSARVDQVVPEHKLRCHSAQQEAGGGGVNVARAIHKLGGQALALYTCGGLTGTALKQLLTDEAIQHQPLPIKDWTRESFAVLEESTGLQYRFSLPGPHLQTAEWRQALTVLQTLEPRPQWLVASGSLPTGVPDDFYAQVARIGKELGISVIVDTSGPALHAMADAEAFLLKPNLRELNQLTGQSLDNEAEQERAVCELIESGHAQAIVLSLGSAGVLLATAQGCLRLRSPIVPIVSKIGAGDSLVGGLTLALARGWPLTEAVTYGVAASAACVMTPGTELCRLAETDRLYQSLQNSPR